MVAQLKYCVMFTPIFGEDEASPFWQTRIFFLDGYRFNHQLDSISPDGSMGLVKKPTFFLQGFITPGIGDKNYRIYRGPPTCTKCTPPRPCREAMIIMSLPKSERWEKPCTSEMMGHSPPGSVRFPGGSSKPLKPRFKLEARVKFDVWIGKTWRNKHGF